LIFFQNGKENRKTRQQLMYKAKIFDENQFKKELSELKKENIIIFENDGYYIPNKKEELQNFINKIDKQNKEITKVLNLANEMLKEMGDK
jgi:hypothetical protein